MTAHLLLVTLGPVQDFIAQARRTRDLWYGSHVLSELGRAAARALVEGNAELVFPALKKGDGELEPCLGALRPDEKLPLTVANKLLAEVPSGIDPEKLARAVREAVLQYWREDVAAPVKAKCAGLLPDAIDAVWTEQIDTVVEFAASWLPLGEYAETRRQIDSAIASRKMLRDFGPWTHGRGSVPKSSLDGARETILVPPRARQTTLVRKYRIADGEQLDAVGLVKRAGGEPAQFVPVVNVALASWVELVNRVAALELEKLRDACGAAGVSRVVRADLPCAATFPFDASVLIPSRWRSVFEEQGLEGDAESWGRVHVQPILDKVSDSYPYVACLVADGDHMGRAIDRFGSAADHRIFSEALAQFASEARTVVEQRHRGILVYAGGDDVLAFLPLPEALAGAEDLRLRFSGVMASACSSSIEMQRPTLSVGLGVGHLMESMGDLLALGRAAEREAKRDRNALAVLVDKRSGGRSSWRGQWSEDPVRGLHDSAALLQDRLPARKVYEIASTLARLPEPGDASGDGWARLLALEVRRSLARTESGGLDLQSAGLALDDGAGYPALHARVRAWVARLLIARTFAQAIPRERQREKEEAA
ncbi:MAG: type III-B CRISPR-associated protein Cas10/Cmr2 [Candidatus Schekmanbacteria bacterium]|nr:type III-B CRISPR-associated protein Cas10/Cmr2 [Candidatus Schekmanbacteria bacterium]